ncbi:hypothetical protein MPER_00283, partial [Moniliophthora perniciosa FA553]
SRFFSLTWFNINLCPKQELNYCSTSLLVNIFTCFGNPEPTIGLIVTELTLRLDKVNISVVKE